MPAEPRVESARSHPRRGLGRAVLFAVKLSVTAAALAWAISRASVPAMRSAVMRLSIASLMVAVALLSLNVAVGALRWREVARAYRARPMPPFVFFAHGYLVAGFYNTFVPGNVGGDALRGYAARGAFEHPADSYAAVLLERGFGLSGLGLAVGGALCIGSPAHVAWGLAATAAGLAAALFTAYVFPLLGRFAGRVPPRLAAFVPPMSVPSWQGAFPRSVWWSLVSQILNALAAHALLLAVSPDLPLAQSMLAVPIATLSLYFPFAVAGLGVREAAFVVMLGRAGVPAADATAVSLAYMAACIILALLGGLAHALRPLVLPAPGRGLPSGAG